MVFIATSQQPDALDPRLRAPDLCDRELGLSLPDAATRKALLEVLLRDVPPRIWSCPRSPTAHRVLCAPTWPRWCARRHCGRRRAPVRTASRRRSPGRLQGRADGDPAVVTVGHRGGVGRLGDAGGRRRHGRHQGGADRGRVVAAAASGHLRPPGRGPAEGCAALWPAGLRQDVRGARAGQFRPVERAFRQGCRVDGQVGRLLGKGRPRIVPPGKGIPRHHWFSWTRSTRWRRARAELRLGCDRPGGGVTAHRTRRYRAPARRGRPRRHQPSGPHRSGPLRPGRLEKLVFVEPPDADARREILRTAGNRCR